MTGGTVSKAVWVGCGLGVGLEVMVDDSEMAVGAGFRPHPTKRFESMKRQQATTKRRREAFCRLLPAILGLILSWIRFIFPRKS